MVKRVALAGLGVLLLLAAAVAILVTSARPSHALATRESREARVAGICKVGDSQYYGLVGFHVRGDAPVHFTKAEVTGVPSGLTVQSVQAVSFPESRQAPLGAAAETDWQTLGYARMPLHPVTDVVLRPGEIATTWWLVIKVRINSLGNQLTGAVKISYTSAGHHGNTTFKSQFGANCK